MGTNESWLDELMLRLSSVSGHFTVVIIIIKNNNSKHLHNAHYAADIF